MRKRWRGSASAALETLTFTCATHHLQALSRRLPSSSMKSLRSPTNCDAGLDLEQEREVLADAVGLQQRRARVPQHRLDIDRRLTQQ